MNHIIWYNMFNRLKKYLCPPLVPKLEYLFEGIRLESYCSRIIWTKNNYKYNDQCENSISKLIVQIPYVMIINFSWCVSTKSYIISTIKVRRWEVNRPNRINLPSPRSQWQKIELEKRKIIATGGVLRADLFYWDCLLDS